LVYAQYGSFAVRISKLVFLLCLLAPLLRPPFYFQTAQAQSSFGRLGLEFHSLFSFFHVRPARSFLATRPEFLPFLDRILPTQ